MDTPQLNIDTTNIEGDPFLSLGLHEKIVQATHEAGYTTPTKVQEGAIPLILSGNDLAASAQTGTGKTAAFLLPTLNRLMNPSTLPGKGPRALILVPTRELAEQVSKEAMKWSKNLSRMKIVCIYGGTPYPIQTRQLHSPHEVLVATPGRLIDHIERGRIDFSRLEILILDEADRMLDMGFIEPVEQIANLTPSTRQTLLFSATLGKEVLALANKLLKNPKHLAVAKEKTSHEHIDQAFHFVGSFSEKKSTLLSLLDDDKIDQGIIFTATKRGADDLLEVLLDAGHEAASLHGDMRQRERTRTINALKKKTIKFLVATDVAARGIDVKTISHVVNFDLPNSTEDYVHRIGRTGRAGSSGKAHSLALPKETHLVRSIERYTGKKFLKEDEKRFPPKTRDQKDGRHFPKKSRPFGKREKSYPSFSRKK